MKATDMLVLLQKAGAIAPTSHTMSPWDGTSVPVDAEVVARDSDVRSELSHAFAEKIHHLGFKLIISVSHGGFRFAETVASSLCLFGEHVPWEEAVRFPDGTIYVPRNSYARLGGTRVFILDDIAITGGSLLATIDAVKDRHARVVGIGSIIKWSDFAPEKFGNIPYFSANEEALEPLFTQS